MAYMYILHSRKLNKYYVGACTNLERRLYEHNIGHSKFTSLGVPWVLILKEEFENLVSAKKRFRYQTEKIQNLHRGVSQKINFPILALFNL
jgi:putative endonuclease